MLKSLQPARVARLSAIGEVARYLHGWLLIQVSTAQERWQNNVILI